MKSGFIAVLGLPNAGKSTLTNALVGEKVSIVSWRPQTTRDKIIGIVNGEDYQIVLIDTPGIHVGKSKLSAFMAEEVTSAKSSSDGALYVLDGSKTMEKDTFEFIKSLASTTPTVVVVNKMDIADKAAVMQTVARLSSVKNLEIVPISAATKENLDELLSVVKGMLKDDVAYYPEDMYTDKPLRFMAAEIVREKALKFLLAEIPHGIGVEVVKFETGEDGVTRIEADVICEKDTHKPIIIGKGGETLKKISVAARKELEDLVDGQVYLRLYVKVKSGWKDDGAVLRSLGYVKK
ncbi:MAG TPA: GTPase Era [Clostridiales bacterium]|jgi:GTP-binding protein Era|nr:GTPase Era [Clostridiales bacterium]